MMKELKLRELTWMALSLVACVSNQVSAADIDFAELFEEPTESVWTADWSSEITEFESESISDYGPCLCDSRGTLFQWSYGTSFSGGPDLDAPLVTDRPDFTEATVTVGRGVAQLEFGYTYSYKNAQGQSVRTQSYGEPLLRYGILADWLEFRVALFPLEQRTSSGSSSNSTAGTGDLYTGFKIALTPQEGIFPEMALIPQMNVPTGSPVFTSNNAEPGVNWLYGWEVSDCISTAGNTQANRRIDDTGDSYLEMAQSWTVAYSLCGDLGGFTEWYALFPSGADNARVEHFFNGGFTYAVHNDMQFDIRAGVGLNDAADDYFLGTGLSIRFP